MTLTPHHSPPGLTGDQSTLGQRLGGLCWVLALVQNLLVQFWVASAWSPPYDWSRNYISDLGNTGCGFFALPHAAANYVCSPPTTRP